MRAERPHRVAPRRARQQPREGVAARAAAHRRAAAARLVREAPLHLRAARASVLALAITEAVERDDAKYAVADGFDATKAEYSGLKDAIALGGRHVPLDGPQAVPPWHLLCGWRRVPCAGAVVRVVPWV